MVGVRLWLRSRSGSTRPGKQSMGHLGHHPLVLRADKVIE
jgi:hypothetical protein